MDVCPGSYFGSLDISLSGERIDVNTQITITFGKFPEYPFVHCLTDKDIDILFDYSSDSISFKEIFTQLSSWRVYVYIIYPFRARITGEESQNKTELLNIINEVLSKKRTEIYYENDGECKKFYKKIKELRSRVEEPTLKHHHFLLF